MSDFPSKRSQPATVPFVSVLVPTYRRNDLLCTTISCLLDQDYPSYEIIVVDQLPEHDEATRTFLDSVQSRIRYFVLDRANVCVARNFAYEQSRGDLIYYFDDDMEIPPDAIRRIAEVYQDPTVDGLTVTVLQDRTPFSQGERPGLHRTSVFGGQFMSFRRKVFETIGTFCEWFGAQRIPSGEDADFTYRAVQHGFKLFIATGIAVRHCGNQASGGCERRRLAGSGISDTDMFSGMVVYWRNRKRSPLGLVRAFWRCYHAYVLNLNLLRTRFKDCRTKNARFFRLFRQVLREPWLTDAQ